MNQYFEGDIRAIQDHVIVCDMDFGEHTTSSGIVIRSDDGTARGVHPRWAQVYRKGPKNTDEYREGDWVLVEHGRWTRGFDVKDETEHTVRMVDRDAILLYTDEKPDTLILGKEYANGDEIRSENFTETQRIFD